MLFWYIQGTRKNIVSLVVVVVDLVFNSFFHSSSKIRFRFNDCVCTMENEVTSYKQSKQLSEKKKKKS